MSITIKGKQKASEDFVPVVFNVRNDCRASGTWKVGETPVGSQLDMIVIATSGGYGTIPPIRKYETLVQQLKRKKAPIPERDDIAGIVSAIESLMSKWGFVWFVPIPVKGTPLYDMYQSGQVPSQAIWLTPIKTFSLDSAKTTGFWSYCDLLEGSGKALSEVISCPRFKTVYSGDNGDTAGLVWEKREPTEDEVGLLGKVEKFLERIQESGEVEKYLYLPPAFEMISQIDMDMLRRLKPEELSLIGRTVVFEGLRGSAIDPADLPEITESPDVPQLRSASAQDIPVEVQDTEIVFDQRGEGVVNGKGSKRR